MAVSLLLLTVKQLFRYDTLFLVFPLVRHYTQEGIVTELCNMEGFTWYMFDYIVKSHQSQAESQDSRWQFVYVLMTL